MAYDLNRSRRLTLKIISSVAAKRKLKLYADGATNL